MLNNKSKVDTKHSYKIEIPLKDGPVYFELQRATAVAKTDNENTILLLNKRYSYLQLQQSLGKWWRENSSTTDKKYEANLNDRSYIDSTLNQSLPQIDKNNNLEQNSNDYNSLNESSTEFYDCLETLKSDWSLYTGDTHGNLKKWDIHEKELMDEYKCFHGDFIQNITITHDKKSLYTGGGNPDLKCLNLEKSRHDIKKSQEFVHTNYVRCAAITSDNKYIFTAGDDKVIKRWDLTSLRHIDEFSNAHNSEIKCLKISRDNKYIYSGGDDSYIKEWVILQTFKVFPRNFGKVHNGEPIRNLALSYDGFTLFSIGGDNFLKQISLLNGNVVKDYGKVLDGWIKPLEITFDDQYILTGGSNGNIYQYDIKNFKLKKIWQSDDNEGIMSIIIGPDNKTVFTGGADGTLKEWDFLEQELVEDYGVVHDGAISSMAFC